MTVLNPWPFQFHQPQTLQRPHVRQTQRMKNHLSYKRITRSVTRRCSVPLLITPQSSQLVRFSLSSLDSAIQITFVPIKQPYAYAQTVLRLSIASDLIQQSYAIRDAALNRSIFLGCSDCFVIILISRPMSHIGSHQAARASTSSTERAET